MPSIQPFTEADVPAGADLILWEKLTLTINRVMWNEWPDVEAQTIRSAGAIRGSLQDTTIKHLKAVDETSGELLGFITLAPRRSTPEEQVPEKKEPPPAGVGNAQPASSTKGPNLNEAAFSMVIAAIGEIREEVDKTDHIDIVALVVKQGHRNKGIGRQLMDAAFEHSKSEALPLFVTAEPGATGFFERLGLQQTKYVDMDLSVHARPYEGFGVFRLTGMTWSPA